MPGVDEVVLLVGDAPAHRARVSARGFRVLAVTDEELLRRWRMEAAPLLVVTDGDGVVRYAGGYRRAKASRPEDPEVIRALLVQQVTGSVRWRESVLWMAGQGVTEAWEIGAGKALSGMIKRISPGIATRAIGSPEDVTAAVAAATTQQGGP